MSEKLKAVLADLAAEGQQLDEWVTPLSDTQWATVTTAEGWTVAHQIAHLLWTDEMSFAAISDTERFNEVMQQAAKNPSGFVDEAAENLAALLPAQLLERWRRSRETLAIALETVPSGEKIAWFGPPMSPTSMATARLMETWAHARDVAEALGIAPPRDARAKHVCHLGVRTRGFAYAVRGKQLPDTQIRVQLRGPDGEAWFWGPEDAAETVTGDGYDFALLVTRRRHPDDVDVVAQGESAAEWLGIAQAFAGLPGSDPKRLSERA